MKNPNTNYNGSIDSLIKLKEGYNARHRILTIGNLTLHFSYSTIIAFENEGDLTISKNKWSMTTGKHLNWIDEEKSKRIKQEEFEEKLKEVLLEKGLARELI